MYTAKTESHSVCGLLSPARCENGKLQITVMKHYGQPPQTGGLSSQTKVRVARLFVCQPDRPPVGGGTVRNRVGARTRTSEIRNFSQRETSESKTRDPYAYVVDRFGPNADGQQIPPTYVLHLPN